MRHLPSTQKQTNYGNKVATGRAQKQRTDQDGRISNGKHKPFSSEGLREAADRAIGPCPGRSAVGDTAADAPPAEDSATSTPAQQNRTVRIVWR